MKRGMNELSLACTNLGFLATMVPNLSAEHPALLTRGLKPHKEALVTKGDMACGTQIRESSFCSCPESKSNFKLGEISVRSSVLL